jgi:thiol-disulfide isomerase/thioredoxin
LIVTGSRPSVDLGGRWWFDDRVQPAILVQAVGLFHRGAAMRFTLSALILGGLIVVLVASSSDAQIIIPRSTQPRPTIPATPPPAAPAPAPGGGASGSLDPNKFIDPSKLSSGKGGGSPGSVEPRYNLNFTIGDVTLGSTLVGPERGLAELRGNVVLLDFWGIQSAPCQTTMPKVAAWNAELADFGLMVVGAYAQDGTRDQIKATARARGVNYTIVEKAVVRKINDLPPPPHCMVFDQLGTCVYRGNPFDAEQPMRIALGKALVESAGKGKFSSAVNPLAEELKKGKPPASVLPKLIVLANASNAETVADAKVLIEALTAVGRKKLDQAEAIADSDPVSAFESVERLPAEFKGMSLGSKAADLVIRLKKDKAVAAELAARPSLEAVRKVDGQLVLKDGADEPRKPEFQKANASLLRQLRDRVALMKKSWPETKATKEASEAIDRYGVAQR